MKMITVDVNRVPIELEFVRKEEHGPLWYYKVLSDDSTLEKAGIHKAPISPDYNHKKSYYQFWAVSSRHSKMPFIFHMLDNCIVYEDNTLISEMDFQVIEALSWEECFDDCNAMRLNMLNNNPDKTYKEQAYNY